MYLTKIIERIGLIEEAIKKIDEDANEMYKKGYKLVTYMLFNNDKFIITYIKEK